MKLVIQRVQHASVHIDQKQYSAINNGLLIFLGIGPKDTSEDIEWLCKKAVHMRIFNDEKGVMNNSVKDIGGEILVVSQFTLMASTKKGNRPSYVQAAKPEIAIPLYKLFIQTIENYFEKKVQTGVFGADMKVDLRNDGPITILLDSELRN
ncbi:D-aminoacyl-tRNA deacylase [Flavobacteriaceae bacterium F08102]|nr:D-aminoacyl-tRNA deacylase [Flavobacteriaceae bacterium F08102]